tara:strand:- start:2215 stop:2421 length:207 start_codon:yes stop_codon:yes gene_type:complete
MMPYPTMTKSGSFTYLSLEQLDGVPDFIVERWAVGDWRVKWRTSAGWSGSYPSKAAALSSTVFNDDAA